MQSTVIELEATLQQLLAQQGEKQGRVLETLNQYGLERGDVQVYIEQAKANPMVQNIVTLTNYINNQLDVSASC